MDTRDTRADKPLNAKEVEDLRYEGGSDHFTTNRHELHNNEAKAFNLMNFRSEDDAPFIRPKIPQSQQRPYFSATIPAGEGYGGQGCEKVTKLMLRSHAGWVGQCVALAAAGVAVFGSIKYLKENQKKDPSP
eukprot:GFUD01095987.1.p1 GENE.GFUD01095987.1~~GFUD01095987.1.p1  ORF type:complete len:150 (-),score=52.01 GFUD01095987.1:38-433(-)